MTLTTPARRYPGGPLLSAVSTAFRLLGPGGAALTGLGILGSEAATPTCCAAGRKGPTIPDNRPGGASNATHTRSISRRHCQMTQTTVHRRRARVGPALSLNASSISAAARLPWCYNSLSFTHTHSCARAHTLFVSMCVRVCVFVYLCVCICVFMCVSTGHRSSKLVRAIRCSRLGPHSPRNRSP